jgi:hypothetical protein
MACIVCDSSATHFWKNMPNYTFCSQDCAAFAWQSINGGGGGEKWIQKATSKHKGAFDRKAKAHHRTPSEEQAWALKKGSHASLTEKREANLRKTLMKFHKK